MLVFGLTVGGSLMFIMFPIAAGMVLEPTQNDQIDYLKAELKEIRHEHEAKEAAKWQGRFGVDWIEPDNG